MPREEPQSTQMWQKPALRDLEANADNRTGASSSASCEINESRRRISWDVKTWASQSLRKVAGFHVRANSAAGSTGVTPAAKWTEGSHRGGCHVVTEWHFKGLCVYSWVQSKKKKKKQSGNAFKTSWRIFLHADDQHSCTCTFEMIVWIFSFIFVVFVLQNVSIKKSFHGLHSSLYLFFFFFFLFCL